MDGRIIEKGEREWTETKQPHPREGVRLFLNWKIADQTKKAEMTPSLLRR